MTNTTTKVTETVINYRGARLVRRAEQGHRGGTRYIYQAEAASRDWGYWYPTAARRAREQPF